MARASTSLPVPLSPSMRMVTSVGAARCAMSTTRLSGSLLADQLVEPRRPLGLERLDLLLQAPPLERARDHDLELAILSGLVKKS